MALNLSLSDPSLWWSSESLMVEVEQEDVTHGVLALELLEHQPQNDCSSLSTLLYLQAWKPKKLLLHLIVQQIDNSIL